MQHKWPLIYLAVLTLVVFAPYLSPENLLYRFENIDITNFHMPNYQLAKESIQRYHQYPLWTETRLDEPMLAAEPQFGIPGIETFLVLLLPTVHASFRLNMMLLFFLSGIGIYFIGRKYGFSGSISCVMSTVYLLNSTAALYFFGYNVFAVPYAMLPFIVLFTLYAWEGKIFRYSALAAVAFALSFIGGDASLFLYSFLFFALFLGYNAAISWEWESLRKAVMIGVIVAVLTGGMIAIKLLPTREWLSLTNRSPEQGLTFDYETFLGGSHSLQGNNFFIYLIKKATPYPLNRDGPRGGIGIIAFLLMFASIPLFRKKRILFLHLSLIFFVLLMMRSPISYFIWKFVPVFNLQRNMYKVLIIYSFIAALLVGAGSSFIASKLERWKRYIPLIILTLLCLEMNIPTILAETVSGKVYVDPGSTTYLGTTFDTRQALSSNQILEYISMQPGKFRFKEYSINQPFGSSIDFYTAPLHLNDIWGRNNLWNTEYIIFPQVAELTGKQAKFYGMLNMKYLTSAERVNLSGFSFVQEFSIKDVPKQKLDTAAYSYGPYLYQNERVLPRAIMVQHALLVIGEESQGQLTQGKQMLYSLLADDSFDPATSVLISSAPDVHINEAVSSVFIGVSSLPQQAIDSLRNFKGSIIPDIFTGSQPEAVEIQAALKGNDTYQELSYIEDTPNRDVIDVEGKSGYAVISETYSLYKGWKAYIDGKEAPLLKADAVLTAVYIPQGSKTLELRYSPLSFRIGSIITLFSLALVIFLVLKR